jgi:hypothetical protein
MDDEDKLRKQFRERWSETMVGFCRLYSIDQSNFSKWLKGTKYSPASAGAVRAYLGSLGAPEHPPASPVSDGAPEHPSAATDIAPAASVASSGDATSKTEGASGSTSSGCATSKTEGASGSTSSGCATSKTEGASGSTSSGCATSKTEGASEPVPALSTVAQTPPPWTRAPPQAACTGLLSVPPLGERVQWKDPGVHLGPRFSENRHPPAAADDEPPGLLDLQTGKIVGTQPAVCTVPADGSRTLSFDVYTGFARTECGTAYQKKRSPFACDDNTSGESDSGDDAAPRPDDQDRCVDRLLADEANDERTCDPAGADLESLKKTLMTATTVDDLVRGMTSLPTRFRFCMVIPRTDETHIPRCSACATLS